MSAGFADGNARATMFDVYRNEHHMENLLRSRNRRRMPMKALRTRTCDPPNQTAKPSHLNMKTPNENPATLESEIRTALGRVFRTKRSL